MSFKSKEMIQSHVRDFKKCQNNIISLEVVFALKRLYCIDLYWLINLLVELSECQDSH